MSRGKPFNREIFARLWNDHSIPTKRIAAALGLSRQGVSHRARRMGLPHRTKVRKRLHDPQLLKELWLFGVSSKEIAEHFGMAHHACACRAARKLGLPKRTRGKGKGGLGGWGERLPISAFWEAKLGERMAEQAMRKAG